MLDKIRPFCRAYILRLWSFPHNNQQYLIKTSVTYQQFFCVQVAISLKISTACLQKDKGKSLTGRESVVYNLT